MFCVGFNRWESTHIQSADERTVEKTPTKTQTENLFEYAMLALAYSQKTERKWGEKLIHLNGLGEAER